MEKIIRIIKSPWTFTSIKWGSRRQGKWVKKNAKDITDERFPLEERYEYTFNKLSKYIKRSGGDIKTEGKEYLPRGTFLILIKNTSKLDYYSTLVSLGLERKVVPVFDKEYEEGKMRGYAKTLNSFFIDQKEVKEHITISKSIAWAKQKNMGVIISPYKANGEIENEVFSIAKKLFIPVVPVSITGLENLGVKNARTEIKIKFHEVMKPMKTMNLKEERLATIVKEKQK